MLDDATVRPPQQARSRQAWERILDVGAELLVEGGTEALTIAEVCRRSGTTPPTLYARVNGKAGLFAAVYARCMEQVRSTEDRAWEQLPRPGASSEARAVDVVVALEEVFSTHEALLRPLVRAAADDADLRHHGAIHARRLLRRVRVALAVDDETAEVVGRTLFSEWVVRVVYGPAFYDEDGESLEEFRVRLTRTVTALVAARGPSRQPGP